MKWFFGAIGAVVLLLTALVISLPFLVDTERIQALIATEAAHMLGRPVGFAKVSVTVLPAPAVRLTQLEVGDDPAFGTAPFLEVETGRMRLGLRGLLSGRMELGEILLERPVIRLVRASNGRLNIASLGRGSAEERGPGRLGGRSAPAGSSPLTAPLASSQLRIHRGTLVYTARRPDGRETPWRLEDFDLRVAGRGEKAALEGHARLMPGALRLTIVDGSVRLTGRRFIEAALAARVLLEGEDVGGALAAQFGVEPSVSGGIHGTLSLSGTLGAPRASGELTSETVRVTQTSQACAPPRRRTLVLNDVTVAADWQGEQTSARPLTARLDGGTVRATVTVSRGRDVHVRIADLAVRALPLERVLVEFLCHGYAVAAPLDLTGAFAFSRRDPRGTLEGSGRLNVGAGRIVGTQAVRTIESVTRVGGAVTSLLGADVPGAAVASPLEFDSITGTFTIARGVLTTRDLLYSGRAMKLTIAGDYALTTERLHLTVLASHGGGETQAVVTGTVAAPSIRIVSSTLMRGIEPKTIEEGLKELLRRFRR